MLLCYTHSRVGVMGDSGIDNNNNSIGSDSDD